MTEQPLQPLSRAEDVTADVLKDAEDVFDMWFDAEEPIDWEDFLDRLARVSPRYDFTEYDNPAIRKIKQHIRKIKREYQ